MSVLTDEEEILRLSAIIERQRNQLCDYAHTNIQQNTNLFEAQMCLLKARRLHIVERVALWFTTGYIAIQLTYNLVAMYGSQ